MACAQIKLPIYFLFNVTFVPTKSTKILNFKFTYTRAGNLHTLVLVNAYTEFYIHGKYIPMTKTIK